MTKQEMYKARLEALQQKAEKYRDFVREAVIEADQRMQAYLASLEQEKAQESKVKELA
jgi:hypothetical protein